ncbi:MAG: polysaccharide export protein [Candidatus Omnitrophica bacterium]|nr:polysaccharide export protein [Candidatus Omnitrophota bacterium]
MIRTMTNVALLTVLSAGIACAQETPSVAIRDITPSQINPDAVGYTVGVDDILTINLLQPERIENEVTVSPDGTLSFPYVGHLLVKGRTIDQIQQEIHQRLSDGYFKYPSVVVSLKESRSRRFFVYGEVNKPGPYPMEDNTTVLRAISMAGGFTRFGSASRVKILRPRESRAGYGMTQVNIKSVMDGDSQSDVILKSGDIVVVSEGLL